MTTCKTMDMGTIYKARDLQIKANFDLASCPIQWREYDNDEWRSTPFQVADANHDPDDALEMVRDWLDMG